MDSNITVNGRPSSASPGILVSALLQELGLEGKRLAVEVNGTVIPRSRHSTTQLAAGDRVEIVHAIGGG